MPVRRAHRLRRLAGGWRNASPRGPAAVRVVVDTLPGATGERLARAAAEALARIHAPGAQVAVRRRGALVWAAEAGPVGAEDRFVIASVTKPVVATLLAMLAERGRLDLDAPVAGWLPWLPHAGRLTPRMLLAHRSGLREYARDPVLRPRFSGGVPDHPWTRQEVIDAVVRLGPERPPDRRFAYRNSNYVVAAEIAERASGRGIAELLDELVAAPLGLARFGFGVPSGARLAPPHVRLFGRQVDLLGVTGGRVPNDALGPVWGDGGIAATADDLARFTDRLFAGALVAPATLRDLLRVHSRLGPHAGYALGWAVMWRGGVRFAGHDGMYFGWTASTAIDDATATSVAVVTGLGGPSVPAARVARALRGALAAG